MQAIVTRFHGPTRTRPGYVSAKADGGKAYANWDGSNDIQATHAKAVRKLCAELGWTGTWVCGALPQNKGLVWVPTEGDKLTVGPANKPADNAALLEAAAHGRALADD